MTCKHESDESVANLEALIRMQAKILFANKRRLLHLKYPQSSPKEKKE